MECRHVIGYIIHGFQRERERERERERDGLFRKETLIEIVFDIYIQILCNVL